MREKVGVLPHPTAVVATGLRGPADSASEISAPLRGLYTQSGVVVAVSGGVSLGLGLLYPRLLDSGGGPRRRP